MRLKEPKLCDPDVKQVRLSALHSLTHSITLSFTWFSFVCAVWVWCWRRTSQGGPRRNRFYALQLRPQSFLCCPDRITLRLGIFFFAKLRAERRHGRKAHFSKKLSSGQTSDGGVEHDDDGLPCPLVVLCDRYYDHDDVMCQHLSPFFKSKYQATKTFFFNPK